MKITKIYLFLLPSLPYQEELLQPTPPLPQHFSWQKFLNIFFIDKWVFRQRVGKLTEWKS